jgi:DNA-binding transcriptional LysR family regulator
MEFREVRYFLALSQTLNFTKAASACHVSQPALTRAIQKIEDELGGSLFARERNNTHMTELGRMIEPYLSDIVASARKIRQTARRFRKLEEASVALGVMCTIAPALFIDFIDGFRASHPGIAITVRKGSPDHLSDLLHSGEIDVAFMSSHVSLPIPMQMSHLYKERFVIACSTEHHFSSMSNVSLAELDGENYIYQDNCEYCEIFDDMCSERGINLIKSHRSEREDWILAMIAAGMGVGFLPEYSAAFPGIVGCPFISPSVERDVCLVTVAGRRWSPPIAAFVQAVRRHPWPSAADDGRRREAPWGSGHAA